MMRYFDFDVEISAGNGATYPVQVHHSPVGSAKGSMRLPFDQAELNRWPEQLNPGADRSSRQVLIEKGQEAKAFGQRLFEALLTGDVLECYEQSLLQARRQHEQGLRLRLRLKAPELAILPWEYLCAPTPSGDHLCLNRVTPVVRSLEVTQPVPLQVDPPLRILVMACSPSDQENLDIPQEQQRIDQALAALQAKGVVELRWMKGQTWRDLHNELRDGPWHGFHFIGHGGFYPAIGEGILAFTSEKGTTDPLSATQVGRLLAGYPSLRLVMLNACEGARGDERDQFASPAAALASRGIPAVFAMQYDISDWAAREWTRSFYEALAEGSPVDAATAEARVAINMAKSNSLEWVTPVLYLQTPDGSLFDLAAFRPRLHPQPATAPFVADGSLFNQPVPPPPPLRRTGLAQDTLFPEEAEPQFVPLASSVDLPPTTQTGEETMTQEDALRDYVKAIEHIHQQGHALEHNYRPDLWKLLKKLAPGFDVINESERSEYGAPDFTVSRATPHGPLRIGYVEAKKIGEKLDKIQRTDQLKRYLSAIPNLILTNHLEFRWYVNGEERMTGRVATLRANTKMVWDAENAPKVAALLRGFLDQQPEPIRQPKELAERMARLAHSIRTLIIEAFGKGGASQTLHDLHKAFKDVLIPNLPVSEFADMFAQTLAYGLFAARQSHASSLLFRRQDASHEIPRTNPFLRRFFATITGPELDEANFIGFVDDLAQLLALTDMEAVLADFGKHTRQEDPIVHFYETFLSVYNPQLRELRGVYYTPEPVVSYLVRSVDKLLRSDFDCSEGLADTSLTTVTRTDAEGQTSTESVPHVMLLDPACGTGTFTYAVINLIRDTYRTQNNAGMWSSYVREHLLPRLFSFELLMAPYAVAHLKLGMQLAAMDLPEADRPAWAYDFEDTERLNIFLTNTLEEAAKRSDLLMGRYISDEANKAARVKKDAPVMVVLGNPPYKGHSANKGKWIIDLLHGKDGESQREVGNYFKVDGNPLRERNPKWLNDDYVKFIRFAQWRIERTGHGILAFITNHGYLDNPTFRGMRQSLMQSFDDIYVLNLHGNSKKKERPPDGGKDENVFDIQQGVAIGLFVRRQDHQDSSRPATVHHMDLWGDRAWKYEWLLGHDVADTPWAIVDPKTPAYFFVPRNTNLLAEYEQGWRLPAIMPTNNIGMNTHRDHFAIAFDAATLKQRIADLVSTQLSDEEVKAKYKLKDTSDFNVSKAREALRKEKDRDALIVPCLYRPFDYRYVLYHPAFLDRPREDLNYHFVGQENLGIVATRQTREPFAVLAVDRVCGQHKIVATYDGSSIFPLYYYPPKGDMWQAGITTNALGGRTPNLAQPFTEEFPKRLGMAWVADGKGDRQQTIGPDDVFAYMYAVFHSPSYRGLYTDFLTTDFPHLPIPSDANLFRALCSIGDELVRLHLLKGAIVPITNYPVRDNNLVENVRYVEPVSETEPGQVWINATQYFKGVLPEVWEFSIGGYQVCEKWLKDREGLPLSYDDQVHYQKMVAAIAETIRLMDEIDEAIEDYGGWPIG